MKRYILVSVMLLLPAVCNGEEQPFGFRDIPFGTPSKKVVGSLKKEFGKRVSVKKGIVSIRDFELGNMKTTAILNFNHEKKFYGFDLRVTSKTIGDVVSRTSELIYIFKKKYGDTENCITEVNTNNVCTPPINVPCTWDHKDLNIDIQNTCGVSESVTTAKVSLKKMVEEETEYQKKMQTKQLDDAAKKF